MSELPEWVKEGGEAVVIRWGWGPGPTEFRTVTIEKVYKRYVVAGGKNYSLPHSATADSLYPTGDARYRDPNIYDPNCEKVAEARQQIKVVKAVRRLDDAVELLANHTRNLRQGRGEPDRALLDAVIEAFDALPEGAAS